MRMTRAALRAQASEDTLPAGIHIGEESSTCVDDPFQPQKQSISSNGHTEHLIHEDQASDKENSIVYSSSDKISHMEHDDVSRTALRDITGENYPTAAVSSIHEEQDVKRKAKGAKGRKKKTETQAKHVLLNKETGSKVTTEGMGADCEIEPGRLMEAEQQPLDSMATSRQPGRQIQDEDGFVHVSQEYNGVDNELNGQHLSNQSQTDHGGYSPNLDTSLESIEASLRICEQSDISTNDAELLALGEVHSLDTSTPKKSIGSVSKTPKFSPSVHLPVDAQADDIRNVSEDSFVDSIKSRSPSKLGRSQSEETTSDSFVENIITRTPSKNLASPRVEDSVEALDALEEAIEKFSEDMPVMENLTVKSPIKERRTPAKTPTRTPAKIVNKPVMNTVSTTTTKTSAKRITPVSHSSVISQTPRQPSSQTAPKSIVKERVKAFETKPAAFSHRRATSVNITKAVSLPDNKSASKHMRTKTESNASTSMSSSNPPVIQDPNSKKRVVSSGLSTSKPAFVPAKSSKPPTKSSFTLPGEAVAAKLKAQREERQKREDEASLEKKQFKARPVPTKVSRPIAAPRENKSSLARLSVMGKSGGENKENVAPARSSVKPATSTVNVAKSRIDTVRATSGVRRTTTVTLPAVGRKSLAQPSNRITSTSSISSNAIEDAPAASSDPAKPVQPRGKEVYARHRNALEAEAKEKKDKEDAAKKARAEAAERGRQASREWAEKMKKKLASAEKKESTVTKTGIVAG